MMHIANERANFTFPGAFYFSFFIIIPCHWFKLLCDCTLSCIRGLTWVKAYQLFSDLVHQLVPQTLCRSKPKCHEQTEKHGQGQQTERTWVAVLDYTCLKGAWNLRLDSALIVSSKKILPLISVGTASEEGLLPLVLDSCFGVSNK